MAKAVITVQFTIREMIETMLQKYDKHGGKVTITNMDLPPSIAVHVPKTTANFDEKFSVTYEKDV